MRSIPLNEHVQEYLTMQRDQYDFRASHAEITAGEIQNDCVVGHYKEQETFSYDQNIFKYWEHPLEDTRILEYGCGPGRNLLRLAPKCKLVAGADISNINLVNAKQFLMLNGIKNFILYLTQGNQIPEEDDTFDFIFEVICLQHICSHFIRANILSEMSRVVKSGGMMVVQFGFNEKVPSHYVSYFEDRLVGVRDTNGFCDCCVTSSNQIINSMTDLGFIDLKVWFTETVADENHDSWIWCSGVKT